MEIPVFLLAASQRPSIFFTLPFSSNMAASFLQATSKRSPHFFHPLSDDPLDSVRPNGRNLPLIRDLHYICKISLPLPFIITESREWELYTFAMLCWPQANYSSCSHSGGLYKDVGHGGGSPYIPVYHTVFFCKWLLFEHVSNVRCVWFFLLFVFCFLRFKKNAWVSHARLSKRTSWTWSLYLVLLGGPAVHSY